MKTTLKISTCSILFLLLGTGIALARPGMSPGLGLNPMWWHNQQLSQELNISQAQQDKLEANLQANHPKMIDLKAAMQKALFALEGALGKNFNDQECEKYVEDFLQAQENMMQARMANLITTRKILSHEQFKGLRDASKRQHGPMMGNKRNRNIEQQRP